MLNEFENEIDNLIDWYVELKRVLIIAENGDLNSKLYIQPFNEIRYAFDHLVRAFVWEKASVRSAEYEPNDVLKAINASISHIQRAYSDTIEWYYLNVKKLCYDVLSPYSPDQILKATPHN